MMMDAGVSMGEKEHLFITSTSANWCRHYKINVESSLKARTISTTQLSYSTQAYSLTSLSPTKDTPAHPSLLLLYSRQPRSGNSQDVHQLVNGF